MINFRHRILSRNTTLGYSFFSETIWSSSLQQSNLSRVRDFLTLNRWGDIDVSLIIPQTDQESRVRWARYYTQAGNCNVIGYNVPIPAGSNFLKLTFGYERVREMEQGHTQRIVVVNAIRLIFGVPAARELVLETHFSTDNPDAKPFSEIGYASPFDNQTLNLFDDPPIEKARMKYLPEEAAILLDKAFAQPYAHERFILMWSAFEAVIHSLPGDVSNGQKRQQLFRHELGSNVANEEVHRLFRLRNSTFKEGKFHDINFDQECWSLYAALQLALLEDCPQRTAFLAGYEATVKARSAQAQ